MADDLVQQHFEALIEQANITSGSQDDEDRKNDIMALIALRIVRAIAETRSAQLQISTSGNLSQNALPAELRHKYRSIQRPLDNAIQKIVERHKSQPNKRLLMDYVFVYFQLFVRETDVHAHTGEKRRVNKSALHREIHSVVVGAGYEATTSRIKDWLNTNRNEPPSPEQVSAYELEIFQRLEMKMLFDRYAKFNEVASNQSQVHDHLLANLTRIRSDVMPVHLGEIARRAAYEDAGP